MINWSLPLIIISYVINTVINKYIIYITIRIAKITNITNINASK